MKLNRIMKNTCCKLDSLWMPLLTVGLLLNSVRYSLASDTSVTISPSGTMSDCSGSVTVSGTVACGDCYNGDAYPSVYVDNYSTDPSGDDGQYAQVSDATCDGNDVWSGWWMSVTFSPLKKGVNIIEADDNCGDSATLTVTSSGGGQNVWDRTLTYQTPSGHLCPTPSGGNNEFDFSVKCYCLPQQSYAYKESETTDESPTDCFHLTGLDNGADATTSDYTYSASDHWTPYCLHADCDHSCNLYRHIYDPLNGSSPGSDVAMESVAVHIKWAGNISSMHMDGGGGSGDWSGGW